MSENERKAKNQWLDFFLGALGLVGLVVMLIRQADNHLSWKHFIGGFVRGWRGLDSVDHRPAWSQWRRWLKKARTQEASTDDVKQLSESFASDTGREYMMSRPCVDVMAEYNAMAIAGRDAAVMHVSNVYNIKTESNPYIAVSDANAKNQRVPITEVSRIANPGVEFPDAKSPGW